MLRACTLNSNIYIFSYCNIDICTTLMDRRITCALDLILFEGWLGHTVFLFLLSRQTLNWILSLLKPGMLGFFGYLRPSISLSSIHDLRPCIRVFNICLFAVADKIL